MSHNHALPPALVHCQHPLPIDDDELPPWLGERIRTTTHDIHQAARAAQQDEDKPQ